MAKLRNRFAHIAAAKSFEDVLNDNKKSANIFEGLKKGYKSLSRSEEEITEFRDLYFRLFWKLYVLLQFAIDHIGTREQRKPFNSDILLGTVDFLGLTRADVEEFAADL